MEKATLSITMSLDGFKAGRDITQENPLGINGHLLHEWLFAKNRRKMKRWHQTRLKIVAPKYK
ncbi:MAG: hypothetical protein IT250_01455 [Chitinophagaceae bacterium]|nr:hypothetical protein [Chitinophagaceae bacterium]